MPEKVLETSLMNPFDIDAPFPFPIAWTAETLSKNDFLITIPSDAMREFDAVAEQVEKTSADVFSLKPDQFELEAARKFMVEVKDTLDDGPGIALLDRLPIEKYGRETAKAVYWVLGSLLGRPVEQKWDGMMLYDVRDTGKPHGNGVRGSVTNVELYYHTDNSGGIMPPQYVGLLCQQAAMEGGESRLVNWAAVYNTLREEKPHLVDRGFEGFLFDRQMEHAPEAPKVLSKSVFRPHREGIGVCYSSRLMRTGYRMSDNALDSAGTEFLDAVDDIVTREEMQLKMFIERGQIQLINNARVGHSRTSFVDHDDPDKRRHLVRLWLREHGDISFDG